MIIFLFRDVLANKVNVDGTEVQKLIENEIIKCEGRHSELVKQHVQRYCRIYQTSKLSYVELLLNKIGMSRNIMY